MTSFTPSSARRRSVRDDAERGVLHPGQDAGEFCRPFWYTCSGMTTVISVAGTSASAQTIWIIDCMSLSAWSVASTAA
jgi:hypothetical protein